MDFQPTFSLDETADWPAWINDIPGDSSSLDAVPNLDTTNYIDPFDSILFENTSLSDLTDQTFFATPTLFPEVVDSSIDDADRFEVLDPADATMDSFPDEMPATSQVAATVNTKSKVVTKPQPRW